MAKKSRFRKLLCAEQLEPRQLLTGVVINEIHFDPDQATEHVEFIELYNDSADAIDLSGWVIDDAVDFTFPSDASIPAGGYVVVAQDAAEFQVKFGLAPMGEWDSGDKLSNDGENIQLRSASGQVVDEVDYQLGFPWPTVGEFGRSIELIHPSLDNNLAGNWRSSSAGASQAPQTLLAAQDSDWHYRKGMSEASTPIDSWRQSSFVEDASWQTGQTSIGYGDGDDNTIVDDMRGAYTSLYLRNTFTIADTLPDAVKLRVYVDDGAAVWINGTRVGLFHVEDTELAFDDFAYNHDASSFEEITLTGASQFLHLGENTIAIHVLNSSLNSSDLSIDAELIVPGSSESGVPTPGQRNSTYAANAAPQMRQLEQSVQQPTGGEDVTIAIKVTDPDGVQDVSLDYQLVDPGSYLRLTDAAYESDWTTLAMHDDGQNGDVVAGDNVYSVALAGTLNTHRRLVRYRIAAEDTLGATITAPFADDPQPNFAYFIYNGVPDYTGSLRPGVEPDVTYSGAALDDLATYHLIANSQDINNSQYSGSYNLVQFHGTLVYDGIVYDHIEFRNRGRASTYAVGKNKWKLNFTRGHSFAARDNYGNRYQEDWDKINILPGTNPWWRNDVSTEGTVLYEPAAFRLYELAGTPSSHTQYFQFRVIDSSAETVSGDQYAGDFWGLYIGIEQPDGRFLGERSLPDGSIFNMHGGTFGATSQRNQGSLLPSDRSDLQSYLSGIDGGYESLAWWEENLNFDSYFAWNMINHLVNNSDIRPNENVNYYHNQANDQWYTIPWDLDLTFEDRPHWSKPVTQRERIRTLMADHPMAQLAYENRLREVADLLLDNNDAALVVDEYANILTLGGGDQTILDANQAQWDYHPRKRKKGIWFDNFNPALLPSKDFDGLVTYMQDFVRSGGYGYQQLANQGDDQGIPDSPSISYVGEPNFPRDGLVFQTSAFSDPQGDGTFAAMEWRVAEVHNRSVVNYDSAKPYVYEIEGTWESGVLTTFDSQISIPEIAIKDGRTYRARVRMQDTSGHWSHWSDAQEFLVTPSVGHVSTDIVISEINYHPYDPTPDEAVALPGVKDDDFEFIEVLNTSETETISLDDFQLSDGVSFTVGDVQLGPRQRAVVVEDIAAFELRYGTAVTVLGEWSGGLSSGGERIVFSDGAGRLLADFAYDDSDPWPETPDNEGATLVLIDPFDTPAEQFGKYYRWRASTGWGGSPGSSGTGPAGVVINEVLSHTDIPEKDAIELHNTTDQAIDIGGWSLSDSANNLLKYAIPAGTLLDAGAMLVFDEDDFNPNPESPGPNDFGLNGAKGDDVYLVIPDGDGGVAWLVDHVQFGAAANGESFGRVPDGVGRLAPLVQQSLGQENGLVRVGPLVITEINYHPESPSAAALAIDPTLTASDLEFIEIHNPTGATVELADWRLRGEGDYEFPAGTALGPAQLLAVVSFDPLDPAQADRLSAFLAHYGIGTDVAIVGGFDGRLGNSFGRIVLERPDEPPLDDPTFIPHLTEDEVVYDDLAPWPTVADGEGPSLHRVAKTAYGNDPSSWQANLQWGSTPGILSVSPFISHAVFQYETTYDIDLDFSEPIDTSSLTAADFTIQNMTTSQTLTTAEYGLTDLTENSVSIAFSSPLDDGNWQVFLAAGSFQDQQGMVNHQDYRFDLFMLVGDYNRDRSVDAADFSVWRDTLASTGDLRANGDHSGASEGVIDQADYNAWRGNYGAHLPALPPAAAVVVFDSGNGNSAVDAEAPIVWHAPLGSVVVVRVDESHGDEVQVAALQGDDETTTVVDVTAVQPTDDMLALRRVVLATDGKRGKGEGRAASTQGAVETHHADFDDRSMNDVATDLFGVRRLHASKHRHAARDAAFGQLSRTRELLGSVSQPHSADVQRFRLRQIADWA